MKSFNVDLTTPSVYRSMRHGQRPADSWALRALFALIILTNAVLVAGLVYYLARS